MSREEVRQGIARFFGGVVFDDAAQVYRPTVLATTGLAGVRPHWTPQFWDKDYVATLIPGSLLGAVMTIHIGQQQERRIAAGIKRDSHAIELWLMHLAHVQFQETAVTHLDDLIEAIKGLIRGDRTLGAAVVEAGESTRGITTSTGLPVKENATRVSQEAVISFDADVYPSA